MLSIHPRCASSAPVAIAMQEFEGNTATLHIPQRHVPALSQGMREENEVHSPSHRSHACILEQEEPLRPCSDQDFGASLSGVGMVSIVCCQNVQFDREDEWTC